MTFSRAFRDLLQRRFRRAESGYITTEAIIIFPVLTVIMLVLWLYFDVFRQQTVLAKSAYTIADAASRETDEINHAYLNGAYGLASSFLRIFRRRLRRFFLLRGAITGQRLQAFALRLYFLQQDDLRCIGGVRLQGPTRSPSSATRRTAGLVW